MRDPEEDSGVHVGGDAYGSVRVDPRRVRRSARDARTRRRGLVIAGALSCLVLSSSGVTWALTNYATTKIEAVDAGTQGSRSRTGAMNILVVGVDKRDNLTRKQQNQLKLGRETGERTDTMMVIHVSEDHRKVTVVSLPRDTWTTIPGNGEHKINAAYQLGGPKLTTRTVQAVTGLTIHHYVEVNVLGFIEVVDALGGISVCTPVPINDPKTALNLEPGTYSFDGVKALAYARTRATARSDLDRIDRQQQVISALLNQALSGETLTNPVRLASFVDTTLDTIRVDDALRGDLLGLANQLKDVSTDDVTFAAVPLADVDYKTPTGESAVLWDSAAAKELFRRIAANETLVKPSKPSKPPKATPTPSVPALTIAPSRIALTVLNGTTITGLGAQTRADLQKAGFLVPETAGNTPRKDFDKTVIRYGPGREDSARTVAAALPGADLRPLENLGDKIEVVVGRKHERAKKVTVKETAAPTPAATPTATPTAKTATDNICKK